MSILIIHFSNFKYLFKMVYGPISHSFFFYTMSLHSVLWFALTLVATFGCKSRDFGNGGTVCVCTKNDCDTIEPVRKLSYGEYQIYTSSKSGARFQTKLGRISKKTDDINTNVTSTIHINTNQTYQEIYGFGGAFTDSAGINLLSLSDETRNTLMRAYFSNEGIEYTMGRIPIGGTDFSTRAYTLDDVDDDFDLKFFALQLEDTQYKIPFILQAMNMTGNNLKLFGTAWTAPAWMKTNDRLSGIGFLNISMYDVWAQYYIKFLDAYRNNGITLWGLTTGNEPANGFNPYIQINDMGWVPLQLAQWIAENLGPKIRLNPYYVNTKIMIVDDQRVYFPWIPRYIMQNQVAASYIDGCAVHYYTDQFVNPEVLSLTHYDFPDKFILATEACEGSLAQKPVILGSWDRGEKYTNSIIDDLNNWSTGWMDWNIALNLEGGPTYVGNFVDSPIIVNKTADEFYKQPMYYSLGHFSKFLRPGAIRVQSIVTGASDFKQVSFKNPDGKIVVTIFNPNDYNISVNIHDESFEGRGNIVLNIEKRSVNSVLY